MTKGLGKHHAPFVGYWRIVEMDEWDQTYLDLVDQAYIAFDDQKMGEFLFGVVRGWLDCRYTEQDGQSKVEFSWEGNSEGDFICGRGWAVIDSDRDLSGHLYIHCSDDSAFEARKL